MEIENFNTFIIQDSKEHIPNEFNFISDHFVFDVKYDGRRNVILVVGRHITNPDISGTYSGIVSIEYVRFILLSVDLSDLGVIVVDVGNTY